LLICGAAEKKTFYCYCTWNIRKCTLLLIGVVTITIIMSS